ncbi:MAG TPA: IMP dehydrogenase [Acidimicrobiales bacterium]|nr:IMP dehydrogenase [Acidimicrobiales bacterium]
MTEVEIGSGKSGRRAYALSDIAIVPSRRTRDPADVDVRWEIDAYELAVPILGHPSVVATPAEAVAFGELGAMGILDLEGLSTRHDEPQALLDELGGLPEQERLARTRDAWSRPIQPELIVERIREVKEAGGLACAALRPQAVESLAPHVLKADVDLFVIRGRVVSAEHVSRSAEPLNLKQFIRSFEIPVLVGGCASYQAALHLMRSGAVGVIVGVPGVPLATTIADAAGARMAHLVETGVYVHVVADGAISTGDDLAKAIACGADAAVLETPPGGVAGAVARLRREMASSGHETLREFQKADVVVVN